MPTKDVDPDAPCPCGLGQAYHLCCGRLHRAEAAAATAELLMRSRFSAFAVRDTAYLLTTWHPTTRPSSLHLDGQRQWNRLEVLRTTGGSFIDSTGTVEFRAHYDDRGRPGSMHEDSRFVREAGLWLYLDAMA